MQRKIKLNFLRGCFNMESEVTIYKNYPKWKMFFNEESMKMLNTNEIFFDDKNFRLRHILLEDKRTFKITQEIQKHKYKENIYYNKSKGGHFSFGGYFDDDILGKYILEQEDDWFNLIKK